MGIVDMDLNSLGDFLSTLPQKERGIIQIQIDTGDITEKMLSKVSDYTKNILDQAKQTYIEEGGDREGFESEITKLLKKEQ